MVAIEAMNHETAIDTYRKAEKALNAAQASIDRDIAYWLMRIAKNNGINMAEARKLLQGAELEEFKWTVEEYIARGRAGGVDEEWMKQLENASARAHITKLEALKLSLRNHLETAYGVQSAGVSDLLSTVYQNSYHRTAYEVQKGTGVGFTFGRVDTRKLDKIINSPWAADGSSWSDRVWTRKTLMTNTLQNELTRTILSGEAPDKAIENMTQFVGDNVKNAKAAAGRLVMTESAAIASSAQKDCYKELGVEEFQIIATLDRLTCDVCGPLDEQHFPVKEFGVGASVPPFHPNCRCTTAPYFDDEFEHDGERAYRGDDGKTHYVEDMSYEEWSKKYLASASATTTSQIRTSAEEPVVNDKTKSFVKKANPGSGELTYDTGFNKDKHQDEINAATWLHQQFGGNIQLLTETNAQNVKTPDFLWNGTYWECKTISSDKFDTIDKHIRKAYAQIIQNPGGIVVDVSGSSLSLEDASQSITKSAERRIKQKAVIIAKKENDFRIYEINPKE